MCKKNNYIQVSATVQSQTCNLSCNTTVTYVVNVFTLTGNVVLNEVLNQGGMVDIFYDQNNPQPIINFKKYIYFWPSFNLVFSCSNRSINSKLLPDFKE